MKSAWWRARAVLAAAIFVATHVVVQPDDDDAIHVEFKVNGQTITLPDDVRAALRNQADTVVRHCGYDGGDQEAQMWLEALAEPSSIRLVYATTDFTQAATARDSDLSGHLLAERCDLSRPAQSAP